MQEKKLVDWIQNCFGIPDAQLLCGVGDDAAVLRAPQRDLVVTTDLIADGPHFDSRQATPEQIGRKAMAVNLSDIAAMAATPVCAFVSLLVPHQSSQDHVEAIMQSIIELGRQFDCPIAGGDTNCWDGKLAINITVVGKVSAGGPMLRSSAVVGDYLLVTGVLGGSIAGHQFDFTPRIREALLLWENYDVHAGMDLSDGLAVDLRRMCAQSGCGADVFIENLPVSAAAKQLSDSNEESVRRALGDGEDFELLLAVPEAEARRILHEQPLEVPVTHIGVCESGDKVWQRVGQQRSELPRVGYEHGSQVNPTQGQTDS